jgi:hypothetical protein
MNNGLNDMNRVAKFAEGQLKSAAKKKWENTLH